ncbi:hypothetical protein PM082_001521 [Marasmius tenuissimus]|nr:hypothetical protein PM082_001521 [Marasmius tenuissimus]
MVAELSSENEYDDEEEKELIARDDDDFIDDTIQKDAKLVLPPRLPALEASIPDSWMITPRSRSLEDESKDLEGDFQSQLMQILQRTDPELLRPNNTRVRVPSSVNESYSHFLRPNHVLEPEPSIPYSFSTTPKPEEEARKRKLLIQKTCSPSFPSPSPSSTPIPILEPSSISPSSKKRKTLADVSASSAPFGTFIPRKPPSDAREKWSKWVAGHPEAPDSSVRRRELAPGEWVEVKAGLYKGDAGMVWRPDTTRSGTYGYFVLLVPRLSRPKQPKPADSGIEPHSRAIPVSTPRERPPPRLFSPEDFDRGVERESDHIFRFRRQTFSHGLVVKFFRETSVAPSRVVPPNLGELFLYSKHPFVVNFPLPLPQYFVFQIGDRVLPSGESRTGIIDELSDNACVVNFGDLDNEKHPYALASIEKVVTPGDTIRVLGGEHLGKEGLVSERHGSTLCVLAREDRHTKTNFFVNINSVKVETLSFDQHEDMPWLNLEVIINRGRYCDMRAVVKSVRLTPLRDCLRLLLFVTELACSVELELDAVVEAITKKNPLDYQPLRPSQKARFGIDELMAKMRTGRVPWVGMRVQVTGGAHKGKGGIVRDVDRSTRDTSHSGLDVSVELQVISPNMSHRVEKIDYAHIREVDSRLELAKCMPLTRAQDFYRPWVGTKQGELKKLRHGVEITENPSVSSISSSSATPIHVSEYEGLDWDDTANPWNPHSLSPTIWSSPDFDLLSSPTSPIPDTVLASPRPRPSRRPPPPSPPSTHWILHPRLLGIPIRVTITGGKWKRKSAYVTSTSSDQGPFIAFHLKDDTHAIDGQWIRKHTERPKPNSEQALMVVTAGEEQHIGKFARRISYFFNESRSDNTRWLIVGVVDRTGRQDCLTNELLELPPTHLDVVEESKEDREAGNALFEGVRYAAKVGKPEIRRPGEGDLSSLRNACSSALIL